jgi:hypothetical protein
MSFVPESVTFEGSFRVHQPAEHAFPLFSPRGEEAWVPGWKPEMLHPAGAEWETGLVFRTVHDGQESIWFVRSLDRDAHRVTYDRVDLGMTATTVSVRCEAAGSDTTNVSVTYTFVGITDAGNAFVRAQKRDEFAAKMERWQDAIAALRSSSQTR